jgi:hypothetical protein
MPALGRTVPIRPRESGADSELLTWTGEGWEHGAIQLRGTAVVIDWTASQFEHDPAKARQYPQPFGSEPLEATWTSLARRGTVGAPEPSSVLVATARLI